VTAVTLAREAIMCRSVLAGAILAAAVTTMSAACANAQVIVQNFTGIGDFHPLTSGATFRTTVVWALDPSNAVCYTTNRLNVGDGSTLIAVIFFVQNSGPTVSEAELLTVDPSTNTFVGNFSGFPTPNTPDIQAVSLDLGDGVLIQDAAFSTHLVWCNSASDGTQILFGAQIQYLRAGSAAGASSAK
jgi:hypothetical protein